MKNNVFALYRSKRKVIFRVVVEGDPNLEAEEPDLQIVDTDDSKATQTKIYVVMLCEIKNLMEKNGKNWRPSAKELVSIISS